MNKASSIEQAEVRPLHSLPTGISGFDTILGGGLPANHLYLIQGLAGSGKTTLACQIGFAQAQQGKKVLMLTLIAESHAKLLQHLGNFSFFDASLVGSQVVFFSGYHALSEGGLNALLEFISATLSEQAPDIMIIDGFRAVRDSRPSDIALSEFMHLLNSLTSTMGCTAFLLSPVEGNEPESENTLVDGLIELSQYEDGMRLIRELKVYKVRGSNHLLGKHVFEIRQDGIAVYPRLEALATRSNTPPLPSAAHAGFGIPSLDALAGNGVMKGSSTNLVGHPGIGKTTLGLHFIHAGIQQNERCLILGFYESPARLLQKAQSVGIDLAPAVDSGQLEILWHLPLEVIMDSLASRLLENIARRGVTRLFIDGVEGFHNIVMHAERMRSFLVALVNELRTRGVTTLFTQELPYFKASYAPSEASATVLYENIMLLTYANIDGVNHRQFSIMKMRENAHSPASYAMSITDAGIHIDCPIAALQKAAG